MSDMVIDNDVLVRWLGNDLKPIIPSNVKKIGKFAFADTNVEEIILSDVQKIERGAFFRCKRLHTIVARLATAGRYFSP